MDNTTSQQSAPVPVAGDTQTKIDKELFVLEREDFSRGASKGFGFWTKSYKTIEGAVNDVAGLTKKSRQEAENIVLGLLNGSINANLRNRATSKLPTDDNAETQKKMREDAILKGHNILVSEVEAENYVPGTREKTSIPALYKDYELAKSAALKAKEENDSTAFEEYKAEAKAILARIEELRPKDEDLDNL